MSAWDRERLTKEEQDGFTGLGRMAPVRQQEGVQDRGTSMSKGKEAPEDRSREHSFMG